LHSGSSECLQKAIKELQASNHSALILCISVAPSQKRVKK